VDDEPIVHGNVGADDDVVGADDVAAGGRDLSRLAIFDFLGVHAGVNAAAIAEDRPRESLEILHGMNGRLARKAKGWSAVPEGERNPVNELGVGETGAMCGVELTLEILARFLAAEKEVTLDSLELAIYVFHRGDAFDAMDSRHVTLGGDAGALLTVESLDVVVPIVEGSGEMGSGTARFTATDWAVVDDDNRATGPGQQVCGGQARDSGPHNADVGTKILGKGLELWHFGSAHPDGGRVT